jgi:hypothetical protein
VEPPVADTASNDRAAQPDHIQPATVDDADLSCRDPGQRGLALPFELQNGENLDPSVGLSIKRPFSATHGEKLRSKFSFSPNCTATKGLHASMRRQRAEALPSPAAFPDAARLPPNVWIGASGRNGALVQMLADLALDPL